MSSPSRAFLSYPPATWLARLRAELVNAGIDHDLAGLVARRVVSALVPQTPKLEPIERREIPPELDFR